MKEESECFELLDNGVGGGNSLYVWETVEKGCGQKKRSLGNKVVERSGSFVAHWQGEKRAWGRG